MKRLIMVQMAMGLLATACWLLMFLAGTDVWHDIGRPDLFHNQAIPYSDVRIFIAAFYLLFFILLSQMIIFIWGFAKTREGRSN